MKDILDKLTSYNLFNYLLPGVIFCILTTFATDLNLVQSDIITGAFLYYFVGLIISRFGSLIIEPLLKKVSFLKFATYKEFVSAEKKDEKLNLLSETNNMYRTFTSLFVLLGLLKIYLLIEQSIGGLDAWRSTIGIVLLLIMFLFSYRKQTSYITKRVKANKDE